MINQTNIRAYINFLHLKKYSAPATEELKNRWATVPEYELETQLYGLYQHWGIDVATANFYEQSFLNTMQQPTVMPTAQQQAYQPPQQQQYQQPYNTTPAQRNSKTPFIIGSTVIVLAIAGFLAFKMFDSRNDNETTLATDTPATTTPEVKQVEQSAVAPAEEVPETPTVTSGGMDDNDVANVRTIESLLRAEESRNLSSILSNFSTDVQQYWDISYPTQTELSNRYSDVWRKSDNGKHLNVRIEKVKKNTYDMLADYQFLSVSAGVTKSVNVHVRYVLDSDNKIIKTYGVK